MGVELKLDESIFDDDATVLVNPVNCVGVMGAGLALQFKQRYPAMFSSYQRECRYGRQTTKSVCLHAEADGHVVANLATKQHWRDPSEPSFVADGLGDLVRQLVAGGFTSVAIPALGCGLGGLEFSLVEQLVERAFAAHPEIHVRLYAPHGYVRRQSHR